MLADRSPSNWIFLFSFLMTDRAFISTTDGQIFGIGFNAEAADRAIGVIRFAVHNIEPMSTGRMITDQFHHLLKIGGKQ